MKAIIACAALAGWLAVPSALAQQPQRVEPPAANTPRDVSPPDRSRGGTVIKPPRDVDPGIKAPTPPAKVFPMPVIKPPVTPAPAKPER